MKLKKPYYTINIRSEYCGYRITVNGCFIEVNRGGEPLSMEYPINQWLKTGENKIEVFFLYTVHPETRMRDLTNDAKLKCELLVREFDEEDKTTVSTIDFDGKELPRMSDNIESDLRDLNACQVATKNSTQAGHYEINNHLCNKVDDGDIEISEITIDQQFTNAIHLSQTITLDTPFPEWAFFKGDDNFPVRFEMTEDQWNDLKKELLVEYQKLWDIVNAGNAKDLEPFLEARCLEYDQAFYTEPGYNLKDFIRTINQSILDPELTLDPLELKDIGVSVSFNRKVLWLHGYNPLSSAFGFLIEDSDLITTYPFYYSKINGEWVIVR